MQKVEHIGIAVKDLATSIALYQQLLDTPCYKTEQVESEQVSTAFFQKGETKIELLQALVYAEYALVGLGLLAVCARVLTPVETRTEIGRYVRDVFHRHHLGA